MSSSFSLTKQTFKEKMGRSHATLDDQFSSSWANCQQLEDIVDRIRAHMFDYLEAMKALCISGHAVADDFKSFYERSPERLTTISIKYEMIQNGFRTDKIALLSRLLNQNVFLKMEEFKVELAGLRSKVGDREVARKRYDHYHSKIQDLRDSRTKAKAKGKELSVSDLDKLTRNERKYEDARLEYVAINRLVARALWNTWARRFQILDPIYAEVIKIKANFTQALSNQLQIVLAPLKTQMMVELHEEPLPAVFAPAGAPASQAAKGNGAARGHFGEEDGGMAGHEDGEYGVMSPGGTQEMDPRKLQAKMHAATEKLETDAALAQKKAQEKQLRANQKAGRNTQAGIAASLDLEQTEEHTDDDESAEEAAARKAKAAKAKAKAAAAAASAAAISTSAPSATSSTKRQPSGAKPVSPPTEDDDSDDIEDSDDDDEEARRKARKAAKKEQKRQAYKAQTAAAAAQAMANAAEARKAPKMDSSLDFLADMVNSAPASAAPVAQPKAAKPGKAAKAGAPVDLLAFSPVKEAQPASSMSLLDFAAPTSAAPDAAPAKKGKGRALELDSFFGAAATTSAAPGGAAHPAETHAPPLDPFFNLPGAESAEPVDLLAVPPPPKPQPHIPAQAAVRTPAAPGGAGSTNALDDPFFAAPLPMPASITPKAPGAAGGAAAAKASKPAAAKPAAAKKKSKSTVSSSEESSDSSDSESSDSEQEEGRPPPKKKTAAPKKAAAVAAAAAAGPAAGAGSTSDPFDFVQNPTQSQREASATPAARSQQAADRAAAKAAGAVQSPKKPAAAAAPPAAAPPAAAAAAVAKTPKPVVGRTPSSGSLGLSDVYVPSAAAPPAPAPAAAAAASSKPKKAKQPDALSPGSASPGAAVASPEDYSPTRDNYSPFPDGQKKPPSNDPFAGVNEDW